MESSGEHWRWRPEPLWLMMSLLGLVVGAVVGALIYLPILLISALYSGSVSEFLIGLAMVCAIGGFAGVVFGLPTGFVVGVVLMFLVGRDLPRESARPLAFIGAAITTASALVVMFSVLQPGLDGGVLAIMIAASLAAGLSALWFQGKLPTRTRSDR